MGVETVVKTNTGVASTQGNTDAGSFTGVLIAFIVTGTCRGCLSRGWVAGFQQLAKDDDEHGRTTMSENVDLAERQKSLEQVVWQVVVDERRAEG